MKNLFLTIAIASAILSLTSCEQPHKIECSSILYGYESAITTDNVKVGDTVRIGYNMAGDHVADLNGNPNAIGHNAVVTKAN